MNRRIYIIVSLLLVAFGGFFTSCNEEKFTADPAYRLSFSTDTIDFDTVFTTIGSATRTLMVRNSNDKGLNIVSVRLASGGNSGFMVNVDGHHGADFTNVEVRKKDSLHIFVEINVDPLQKDNPILIKDSLIFQLESGLQQDVKLLAYGRDILIIRGKIIDRDTTFTSYRPIVVYDSLQVNEGKILTLSKGTGLYFHDKINCLVYGTLRVEGTVDEPVVLRGDRTDRLFTDVPYDRVAGQWGGVHFFESSYDNRLDYVDIHGGTYGIRCDSSDVERTKLTLVNSVVHNVKGDGLSLKSCKVHVGNSQISNAGKNGVSIVGGEAEFVHCTIVAFYSWDIRKGVAVYLSNEENEIVYPLLNADFRNCLITGSGSDELSGGRTKDESVPFNYNFTYSLVNTKLDEKSDGYEEELSHYLGSMWDDKKDENKKSLSRDKNFLYIGKNDYDYDFRLDSLSAAVNMALRKDAEHYPLDRNGRNRFNDVGPDAGCYEWMNGDKKRNEN